MYMYYKAEAKVNCTLATVDNTKTGIPLVADTFGWGLP